MFTNVFIKWSNKAAKETIYILQDLTGLEISTTESRFAKPVLTSLVETERHQSVGCGLAVLKSTVLNKMAQVTERVIGYRKAIPRSKEHVVFTENSSWFFCVAKWRVCLCREVLNVRGCNFFVPLVSRAWFINK